jgi:hypothetical protein
MPGERPTREDLEFEINVLQNANGHLVDDNRRLRELLYEIYWAVVRTIEKEPPLLDFWNWLTAVERVNGDVKPGDEDNPNPPKRRCREPSRTTTGLLVNEQKSDDEKPN